VLAYNWLQTHILTSHFRLWY